MKTQPEFRLTVTDDDRVMWLHEPTGRLLPIVSGGDGDEDDVDTDAASDVEVPEDLSTLDDEQLRELIGAAETAIKTMADNPAPTSDEVVAVQQLQRAMRDMKAEQRDRAEAAAKRKADFDRAVTDALGDASDAGEGEGETESEEEDAEGEAEETGDNAEGESAETKPAKRPPVRIPVGDRVGAEGTRKDSGKLNLNSRELRELARRAPDPGLERVSPMRITAAGDIPRFVSGQELTSLDQIAQATINRAKSLGVSNGMGPYVPLCTIERDFPLWLDETTPDNEVMERWNGYLAEYNAATVSGMEALVAAGGWCAPSEIDYSMFNIAAVAGLLDVPTFGVARGGVRHPQNGGIGLHDFFALAGGAASGLPTNASMPWQWTETDDIAATGASPRKTCLRPPCPTFTDDRLTAYGICVLAGNLTEEAYPELIRDFIAKAVVAHARAMNRRLILAAVAFATATTPTANASSSINAALGGLDLNAVDYREKWGMADDAVLEVVAPAWIRGTWRSDLAKKNGIERLDASDAYLMALFDTRNLRVQFVQDWQTRLTAGGIAEPGGAAPVTWPTTATVLMHAPGTFARGNGPTLDLGVVRDSTLNAANDHTAAWSEESTLIAKMGHEARVITLSTVAAGGTASTAASPGP